MLELSVEQKKMVHEGVWELTRQVKAGRAGAMTDVETLINLALADDLAFLRIARSLAEDAERREQTRLLSAAT